MMLATTTFEVLRPMWLNSTSQTALSAVIFIAEHADGGSVRVDDIAAALGAPRNYLSKTLHVLARANVLRSARGPGGGFRLVDPPTSLTLDRIVAPFTPASDRRCLVGRPICGDANPCRAHHRWSTVAGEVEAFFAETTIADLLHPPVRITRTRPSPPTVERSSSDA